MCEAKSNVSYECKKGIKWNCATGKRYVRSDPNYQKLTQEGQVYCEQSFLAFLDFLEKTKNLELLRRKEDLAIIEKIDIFHLKHAKEIISELDKFKKKQQVKVENVANARKT